MAESRSPATEAPVRGRLTISEAAARTGLSAKMIRYYEQEGLFVSQARSAAGYRQYGETDLHALRFIRSARDLGFSLKQIAELTGLWHDRTRASAEVKRLALSHIDALEAKAALLRGMAGTLRELAQRCHGDERPECPILQGIEDGVQDQASAGACHSDT